MYAFQVNRKVVPFTAVGPRAREIMRFFGVSLDALRQKTTSYRLSVSLNPGQVCVIVGPSGAGKSVLLNALCDQIPSDQRIRIEDIPLESQVSVIDCFDAPPRETMPLLCRAGLSDVWCLLQPPAALSDGQKWRYRLAKALITPAQFLIADEFCAALDTTTALVIAYQLRRLTRRTGRIAILAGPREDILAELKPDVLVSVNGPRVEVWYTDTKQMQTTPQDRSVATQ